MKDLDGLHELLQPDDGTFNDEGVLIDNEDIVVYAIELYATIEYRMEDAPVIEAEPFEYKIKYEGAPQQVECVHHFGGDGEIQADVTWKGSRHGDRMVYTVASYQVSRWMSGGPGIGGYRQTIWGYG